MNIQLLTKPIWQLGKCNVSGKVLGYSRDIQVQEHLETIYYLGLFRIVIKHKFKFKPFL